jgi:L-alanine-DL-glutamate epimerase-like enolase superfamily enzyme
MTTHRPPTIDHIETTAFRLPMEGVLQWGKHSKLAEVFHLLVRVHLSDGSIGSAEAPPRPTIYGETAHTMTAIIRHELAPRICGLPVLDADGAATAFSNSALDRIGSRLHEIKNNHVAKGALDMALHDAIAQHLDVPLRDYLGATTPRLRASFILGLGDRDSVLAEAKRIVAQGVRVLRVKVGRDWADDLARIAELQTEFGSGVDLYVDANECLAVDEAPTILARLAEMGILYCEEPLPVELVRERAHLRAGSYLPLIADDSAFTARDLERELALNTFDILNIKTARTGYTESWAMLQRAHACDKGVMVGSQASAGFGAARAALFAALPGIEHPSELSFFLKLKEDIIARPIPIVDGYICLDDAANVQPDPDLLRAAAVNL